MAKILPSILSADFVNLERDIHDIEVNGADWVHVDVMDGVFVPNITIGIPVVRDIRRVTSLPLDVHLMIDRPIRYAESFIKAGADWLTIHLELLPAGNHFRNTESVGGRASQMAAYHPSAACHRLPPWKDYGVNVGEAGL